MTPDISINSIDTGIMPATAVVWSNCDRNCAADCHYNKRNGRLSPKERKALHSVETKILRKEIEILRPTHIVFLGWYEVTIKQNSLPDYTKYQKLGDKYNYPLDIKTLFCEKSEIKVYYLYHPAYRQNVKRYSEDFANVINDIKTNQNKW